MMRTTEAGRVAGIDVGKYELEVALPGGEVVGFGNDETGLEALLVRLRAAGVTLAVCESSGGYERGLVSALQSGRVAVHVAHPNKVRGFMKACGREGKTDRLDAVGLQRYGDVMAVSGQAPRPAAEVALEETLRRRRQLVSQRAQEKTRLEGGLTGSVQESCARHLAWLDEEIKQLEVAYQAQLAADEALKARAALYQSVCGVGALTAATLLAWLPELGELPGPALVSLVGVAPWSRDSGTHQGKRCIRGGRKWVRHALYLSALSAIRHDAVLREYYQGLVRRGKPGKVAVIAVLRKLVLRLHAVARRGTPWQAAPVADEVR